MVGSFIVNSHSSEKSPSMFMEVNEKVDRGTVFTIRLSTRMFKHYQDC